MDASNATQILMPVLAMGVLVMIVYVRTFLSRVSQMKSGRIHPQQVHSRAEMAARVQDSRAADHLSNLFELPVLFYAGCILVYLTGTSDGLFLILAWAFVAFRFAQAFVHLTFNHVMTRLAFFALGLLTFMVFWVKLILELLALG